METASTTSSVGSADGRSAGGGTEFLNLGMLTGTTGGSTQQQSSDLLVGGAGGGFSLGNGFGNVSGGASSGASLDLNDFPSLSGGGAPSGNGIAAALREQQQLLAQSQMLGSGARGTDPYKVAIAGANGAFSIASEDFPALSGTPTQSSGSGVTNGSALTAPSLLGGTSASVQREASGGSGLYGTSLDSGTSQLQVGTGLLGGAGLGGVGEPRGLQHQTSGNPGSTSLSRGSSVAASTGAIGSTAGSGSGTGSAAGNALSGDYGLLGLLSVIRMTDADRKALALGSDLTLMGLNLGSPEQIYSTFTGPWSDGGSSKEPHYQLPMCYYMQPPALKTGHLSKFQLETLFYIFYALPKDVLQAYAAQELYSREWRYHGDLKLWFKRAGPTDGVANSSSGSPQYLYFDINSWERRLFNGSMNQNITNGFLPEDEVRVKFPSS